MMQLNPILVDLAIKRASGGEKESDTPKQPPNYHPAVGDVAKCASCKYFDMATEGCKKYNTMVDPNWVCDSYEQKEPNLPDAPPPDIGTGAIIPELAVDPSMSGDLRSNDNALTSLKLAASAGGGASGGTAMSGAVSGTAADTGGNPTTHGDTDGTKQPLDDPAAPPLPPQQRTDFGSIFGFSSNPSERMAKIGIALVNAEFNMRLKAAAQASINPPAVSPARPNAAAGVQAPTAKPLVGAQPGDPSMAQPQPQQQPQQAPQPQPPFKPSPVVAMAPNHPAVSTYSMFVPPDPNVMSTKTARELLRKELQEGRNPPLTHLFKLATNIKPSKRPPYSLLEFGDILESTVKRAFLPGRTVMTPAPIQNTRINPLASGMIPGMRPQLMNTQQQPNNPTQVPQMPGNAGVNNNQQAAQPAQNKPQGPAVSPSPTPQVGGSSASRGPSSPHASGTTPHSPHSSTSSGSGSVKSAAHLTNLILGPHSVPVVNGAALRTPSTPLVRGLSKDAALLAPSICGLTPSTVKTGSVDKNVEIGGVSAKTLPHYMLRSFSTPSLPLVNLTQINTKAAAGIAPMRGSPGWYAQQRQRQEQMQQQVMEQQQQIPGMGMGGGMMMPSYPMQIPGGRVRAMQMFAGHRPGHPFTQYQNTPPPWMMNQMMLPPVMPQQAQAPQQPQPPQAQQPAPKPEQPKPAPQADPARPTPAEFEQNGGGSGTELPTAAAQEAGDVFAKASPKNQPQQGAAIQPQQPGVATTVPYDEGKEQGNVVQAPFDDGKAPAKEEQAKAPAVPVEQPKPAQQPAAPEKEQAAAGGDYSAPAAEEKPTGGDYSAPAAASNKKLPLPAAKPAPQQAAAPQKPLTDFQRWQQQKAMGTAPASNGSFSTMTVGGARNNQQQAKPKANVAAQPQPPAREPKETGKPSSAGF